ncbi:MAG: phage tail protein, partial [[Eubacterium] siraeum]|nr:phage tail protein [[Eubacterium] siraeum]
MALQHGINTYKDDTSIVAVQAAAVGIPFFIGAWPCHTAKGFTGKPQYVTSFAEGKELGGYSADWRYEDGKPKWSLCQALYAHFVLMAMTPAVFYNIFDPAKHKKTVPAEDFAVKDHAATLPLDTLDNGKLVVKAGETELVRDVDFEAYYNGEGFVVELLEESDHYHAQTLTIAYEVADPSAITAEDVEMAVEAVEMCRSVVGIVPDLLCAPGWSSDPTVAAVMAAKAPSINGLFRGKA